VFNEFTTAAREHRAEHAFAFAYAGVFALLVLNVHVEGFAFEEQLQVTVVLQHWMRSRLVEHTLQSGASRLNKIGFEAPNGLFLRRWRDNDSGVVVVQLCV